MKILILFGGKEFKLLFASLSEDNEEVDAFYPFKVVPAFIRVLRRIHNKITYIGFGIWFSGWKEDIEKYDVVIANANVYSPQILQWIKIKKPNIRCINYYWDNIKVSKYPVVCMDSFENWSFCKLDCEKYDMQYSPQFYINNIQLPDRKLLYEVCYVGADREGLLKYRSELVESYYQLFEKNNISNYIWYVTKNKNVSAAIRKDKRLTESEYYEIVAQSKVLLDIVEPDDEWITLRPLLALSNKKKLITNCTLILEEKYYSPANVFILGRDDENLLKNFIESDFEEINPEILNYYEVKSWLNRFYICNNKEI